MILKLASGRTAEIVRCIVKNTDGAGSVTANTPFHLHGDGNSVNGLEGGHPATANLNLFTGMVRTTIAINAYKFLQTWGYHTSALISAEGSSVTITAGDALISVAGTGLGMGSGAIVSGYVVTGSTSPDANSAAGQYLDEIIVRAL